MNKKLCICGTHPATRENAPFDNLEYDIWVFNEAPQAVDWCKRWTHVFQMHKREVYESPKNFVNETHWQWLQEDHGDKVIWMQEVDERVPNSKRMPMDEMLANFPAANMGMFTSTAAMAMALGLYLGYEEIQVYGVDLGSNTEYTYQQPGWIYWVGVGKALLGDKLVLNSGLHHFHHRLYGYNGETQIEREFFQSRAEIHEAARHNAEKKFRKVKDRLDNTLIDSKFEDFPRMYLEMMNSAVDLGIYSGALQEAKTYGERPDPIPRQQFERRGATAQRDAGLNSNLMEKEGGKVEYVFNAWKSTGSIEALQQIRVFISQSLKYAHMVGGNTGVMNENLLYLQEYDKRIEAAGGERTLQALGV
jgi:hypothetical protein